MGLAGKSEGAEPHLDKAEALLGSRRTPPTLHSFASSRRTVAAHAGDGRRRRRARSAKRSNAPRQRRGRARERLVGARRRPRAPGRHRRGRQRVPLAPSSALDAGARLREAAQCCRRWAKSCATRGATRRRSTRWSARRTTQSAASRTSTRPRALTVTARIRPAGRTRSCADGAGRERRDARLPRRRAAAVVGDERAAPRRSSATAPSSCKGRARRASRRCAGCSPSTTTTPSSCGGSRDPLLAGDPHLRGLRLLRVGTVAHALLRALCGQLIEASRARAIESGSSGASRRRSAACTLRPTPTLGALSPAQLRALGLQRGAARRSSGSAARSSSSGSRAPDERRRRAARASAGSARGRSASSASRGSAATSAGSSATSGSSSSCSRSRAGWVEGGRPPSCSPVRRVGRARERVPAGRLRARPAPCRRPRPHCRIDG